MTTATAPIASDPDVASTERSQPRRRGLRIALGAGIPLLLAAGAVGYASTLFIAPGVVVAGVPVEWMTEAAARDAIAARFADADATIGEVALPLADLGIEIDAEALAAQALAAHPSWKVMEWHPEPIGVELAVDPNAADAALRQAAPDLYADPVDAQVVFDADAGVYAEKPGQNGRGVDVGSLSAALTSAYNARGAIAAEPTATEQPPALTTEAAQAFAGELNAQAEGAGFFVEGGGSVPLDLATIASWTTVTGDPAAGGFAVTADAAKIDAVVQALPGQLNRTPQPSQVVVNSSGTVLKTLQAGQDGFGLASTDGVAAQVAQSVQGGDFRFELQGQVIPHEAQTLLRTIEVDKSAGRVMMYENGGLVASYPVAIGTGGAHETRTGHFRVYVQRSMQNMGDCGGNYGYGYCTRNVKWVSFFNGDQGFHGTYWHSNFGAGARMSHGCVNMTEWAANELYRFAQVGTEVWVHD
ncbi:L,D-transpeptidase family protein [Microbacterium stercoris]|uniref:L,D-transpeptidase n=1 Tax=Microbacterium stercoris TaxID=2820289 RepID=A0A939QQV7_9MICO|nr:L,D-transpeptidase [Microbacterium stercoris]MBO3663831.1 L,D-transpeptidase [Microbacterium stercoris]